MTVSELYIYPIKSLGGISVTEAVVEPRGLRYDRRFMLVSPRADARSWEFMTQRTYHQMALIDVSIAGDVLRVWHRSHPDNVLTLPLTLLKPSDAASDSVETVLVNIWDSKDVPAQPVSSEADHWFSTVLGTACRLVYMPETTHRTVDPAYAVDDKDAVSFADGYPYLLIGQASLDTLNQRLAEPISMLRFRPNIVVSGSAPYDEDTWQEFRVDEVTLFGVKPCARCVLTTIDPATGQQGKEPLKMLTTYRQWKHKILFGQNVLARLTGEEELGILRVGQSVEVVRRVEPWLAPPIESSTESISSLIS